MKASWKAALLLIAMMLASPYESEAQSGDICANPKEAGRLIDELKDSFECAGFNLRDCNSYRSGLIGGAVGGPIAAGVMAMKHNPKLKGCVGPKGGGAKFDWIDALTGPYAYAYASCTIPRKDMKDNLDKLASAHSAESASLKDAAAREMVGSKLKIDDAKIKVEKAAVRDGMLKNLKDMQSYFADERRGLEATGGDRQKLAQIRETLRERTEILRSASDDLIGESVRSSEAVLGSIPEETRGRMPSELRRGLQSSSVIEDLKSQQIRKVYGPQAERDYKKAIDVLDELDWEGRGNPKEFLISKGYSPEVASRIAENHRYRTSINVNGSLYRNASAELQYGKFKNTAVLQPQDVRAVTERIPSLRSKMQIAHFVPGPGKTSQSFMMSLGREGLAETSAAGKTALSSAGKAASGGAVGTKAATKVALSAVPLVGAVGSVFAETMHDPKCQGMLESPYAVYEYDGETCKVSDARNEKTDAFLFSLTREEQLKELRNPAACDMLRKVAERYAPSRQWKVECPADSNAPIVLKNKNNDSNSTRISFKVGNDGEPGEVQWFQPDKNACVDLKSDKPSVTDVYTTSGDDQKKCEMMDQGTLDSGYKAPNRPLSSKFSRDFAAYASDWKNSNAYTFAAASQCCNGEESSLCPKGSGSGNGSPRPSRQNKLAD